MKVIPEKISAIHASMSVEYPKISWFFPISDVFGFGEVEDDGNSVFVVLADRSLVGGGGVGTNGAMSIFGMLGGFKITDRS